MLLLTNPAATAVTTVLVMKTVNELSILASTVRVLIVSVNLTSSVYLTKYVPSDHCIDVHVQLRSAFLLTVLQLEEPTA